MDQYNAPVISVKDWFITLLICAIPIVNLVMLFVWGFGGGANPNKANLAKAYLVWMVIGIILSIVFFVLFGAAMFAAMGEYNYY